MQEKIYTTYAQNTDITFILKDTIVNDTITTTEVVGFYYGEEDTVNTEYYIGKTKAIFENGLETE